MRVPDGECRRLLINQPPRSLKSLSVSVAFVARLLGHDPSRRIIVVSYASELSAELHRQFRMVIESLWYQELFPAMRPAKDTGTELVTTAGGSRYATTVGGTLTGRGADFIIIDDPLKAEEALSEPGRNRVTDWFGGTLVSRLNDKENAINTEVYVQAREILVLFEGLLSAAHTKRMLLLREIRNQRLGRPTRPTR
ncbi:hypothetical protein [Bradyrhizobium diazoefficiens]|uniref:Terminase large subunit gp17-like C-terminal domain-containing protein n=1 Tax=Bradyrhizobium diazoefficiens TaxID=1355477 RepID=A0A810D066_9BRAD|nr:hypothetical protein [Bradyrhizobium diazoefficiens]WLA76848.1 hypothetical protein QIH77_17255 [Bradyrhizobium diazoefficiens]BCE23795.1 hypothetical protein XF1B_64760 [Bradyrhizobium diazoefficiens]BCE50055.1 hypothetical protein XF4B_64040 [Bradyrhizobium diazoefficiens]BCE93563.1 hypothetical protein XF10B_63610 [Bradyrhizobium diazoefficiens]BCF28499.1 hypothetical protein XF14B_64510 [Bradyrhizobium diazoefficiens]